MTILDFPDLSESKNNTLGFFYSKLDYPKGLSATDFTVNSEDLLALRQKFEKWVRSDLKGVYSKEKLETVISFNWNNMCPREIL